MPCAVNGPPGRSAMLGGMAMNGRELAVDAAETMRSPLVPVTLERLAALDGYLEAVWPQLRASVDTAGFLGSALYMTDMALDAVEEVYQPILSPESLLNGALDHEQLSQLIAVTDVFHWMQPQLLLLCAALAEAFERPSVGGEGRAEPREPSQREQVHLATAVALASATASPLPQLAELLGMSEPPELYRAVAVWPGYLAVAWEELQHLAAYPDFRRRGRALYFYARSSARFLAQPLRADAQALAAAGVPAEAIEQARTILGDALPGLATMMMHCCAIRTGLGQRQREVVGV